MGRYLIFFLFCFLGCSSVQPVVMDNESILASQQEGEILEKMDFDFLIAKGYVDIGMSKVDVIASWGEPKKILHKKENAEDYEIWVYKPNWKFKNKLFFVNGQLVKSEPPYLVASEMSGHGVVPRP